MASKKPKGAPTSLNLWVLKRETTANPEGFRVVPSTSVTHIRRCLDAGLLVQGAKGWILSPAGVEAVATVK